ncbi:MAG: hypothetical protein QOG61_2201, partial [Candidatus Binataceae bacterium]|nr:hypothetical protein [Candidatus Binataceae bacterium]
MKPSIAADNRWDMHSSGEIQAAGPVILDEQVSAAQVFAIAARLRIIIREPIPPIRVAVALDAATELWRDRDYVPRRETVGAV